MNKTLSLMIGSLIACAGFAAPALAADVGVSISVGQPGFYGQIDIGNAPRPRVIYAEPRIIEHVTIVREPVYMHVPPGHAKHWDKHCHKYNACGQRVYFVNDSWYNTVYVPHYRQRGGDGHRNDDGDHGNQGRGKNKDKGKGHGKGK